ncbi:MAG: hypothetical protein AB1598_04715 [Thermodesulfobacteriota bacterium]
MKTKFICAAARFIVAVAVLIAPVASVKAESGADTPEALGNKVLEAIKTQNKEGLKSLIHPEVVSYLQEKSPGELDKVLDNFLTLPVPDNGEFVVQPIEEVSEYDKATQTLVFRENTLYFPVPPMDLLVLVTETEIPKKDEKGKETKVKVKVGAMVYTITQNNNKWFIVLPVKKVAEKREEKQEQIQQ